MKKQFFLPLLCSIFMLSSCGPGKEKPATNDTAATTAEAPAEQSSAAETTLLNFYREYITLNSAMPVDTNAINNLQRGICTGKCIHRINSDEELDFDPFLNAQDCDPEWIKSLQVKNKSSNVYEVSYKGGPETTYRITLFTRTENGNVKIDSLAWPL